MFDWFGLISLTLFWIRFSVFQIAFLFSRQQAVRAAVWWCTATLLYDRAISALCNPFPRPRTHTQGKLTGWSRGNSIWWKTGTALGGVWLSDCDHSGAEMLSSALLITSSLGFIFVLELILNISLCSLFITYCPLLLASSFITADLSHTSFLSVTLFIVWQGF